MDSSDTFQFIILVILLLLSAFFSSAETALMTVNKIRLRSLADDGNRRAALVLDTTEKHTSKMLSAILIGNNIVNISASSLSATLAYSFGGYMVSIATAILTVAILVFGEITPKNFATIHAEKISLAYIPIIRFFMFIMTPIIFLIDLFSRGFMFLLRVDPNARNNAMTEDELRTIVDVSHEDGVIESEEKEMIYNVFDLGDVKAKEVMVPRVHVAFADVNSSYRELIEIFKEYKFTRLPVYEDTTDNVIGTINMKDLLLFEDKANFQVRNILREAYFTYEYKNISELLVEMRDAKFNIAIVLDEYGETAGIITLEDVLEEIVGEIRDEYDEAEEELIQKVNDQEYIVEGSMNLDDLNDNLGTELESEDSPCSRKTGQKPYRNCSCVSASKSRFRTRGKRQLILILQRTTGFEQSFQNQSSFFPNVISITTERMYTMKDLSDFCPEFQEAAAYYASLNTPSDQAILVEFLRETQDIFGCIPNDAKEQIASIMQVKPALIDTLIRLYPSLSSQTYQKEIILCTGSTCSSKQSALLLRKLEQKLQIRQGEVTSDGTYLLRTQKCFKQCGQGPNMKVGDKMYHHVTAELIDQLF